MRHQQFCMDQGKLNSKSTTTKKKKEKKKVILQTE